MATSNDEREHNINEGLRKLEEFQRRRTQRTPIGHAAIRRPTSTSNFADHPNSLPTVSLSPPAADSSSASSAAAVRTSPAVVSNVAVSNSPVGLYELTVRLQRLQAQLRELSQDSHVTEAVVGNASLLDSLQRQCTDIVHEATQAQSQHNVMQTKVDMLQYSYAQAMRTIDLLVAEKSRMNSTLETLEARLRSKAHEVEVQESEMRSLRERAITNEGQMQALRAECERSQDCSAQFGSYDMLAASRKELEELIEQQKQSAEKIHQLQKAYDQTGQALEFTTKELSVAQAYIQQLSGGVEHSLTKRTESVELDNLKEEMATLLSEKSAAELISRNLEASNRGLQDRVAQLSQELAQLAKVKATATPSSSLLSSIVAETANVNNTTLPPSKEEASVGVQCKFEAESESAKQLLEAEIEELQTQLNASKRLADQHCQQVANIQAQMAATGEQLQKAKLDSSRACVQNRELKSQLEELQDAFVKLSNEKLDLTEELAAERHRVAQLKNEKNQALPSVTGGMPQTSLSQVVAEWKERYSNLEKQYSACRDTIVKLQAQQQQQQQQQQPQQQHSIDVPRASDKPPLSSAAPAPSSPPSSPASSPSSSPSSSSPASASASCNATNAKIQNDSPSVSISEYEFVDQMTSENSVPSMPTEHGLDAESSTSTSSAGSTPKSRRPEQFAMSGKSKLQTKLQEALQKIDTLEDEKSYLEHQVVQLQMETDTISDYIQLYQQQRAALSRRQQDKEAQMNQLLSDREELRGKVSQLQALVSRLVPVPTVEQTSQSASTASRKAEDPDISKEVLAREIFSTLEDINQASASVSFDNFKCTSCHGCQGKLISL